MDLNIIDAGVELTLGNGSTINIEEQFVLNTSSNLVEISENGFEYIKIHGHDPNGNLINGEYAYSSYIVLGSDEDNFLIANQPSDAEDNDDVFVKAGLGNDTIQVNANNAMIEGGQGDDIAKIATSGNKSIFKMFLRVIAGVLLEAPTLILVMLCIWSGCAVRYR